MVLRLLWPFPVLAIGSLMKLLLLQNEGVFGSSLHLDIISYVPNPLH